MLNYMNYAVLKKCRFKRFNLNGLVIKGVVKAVIVKCQMKG